jgi:hypothetical protein
MPWRSGTLFAILSGSKQHQSWASSFKWTQPIFMEPFRSSFSTNWTSSRRKSSTRTSRQFSPIMMVSLRCSIKIYVLTLNRRETKRYARGTRVLPKAILETSSKIESNEGAGNLRPVSTNAHSKCLDIDMTQQFHKCNRHRAITSCHGCS